MLDPDMPAAELRLHMGELSAIDEERARTAIRRHAAGQGPGSNAKVAIAAWQWASRAEQASKAAKSAKKQWRPLGTVPDQGKILILRRATPFMPNGLVEQRDLSAGDTVPDDALGWAPLVNEA